MPTSFDSASYLQKLEKQTDAIAALEGHTLQAHMETLAEMPNMARSLVSAYMALHAAAELVVSTHRAANKAVQPAIDGLKDGCVVLEVRPDKNVAITLIDTAVVDMATDICRDPCGLPQHLRHDPYVAVSVAAINFVLEG